jgi:RTX calcium-binding nonapeptide repeat (4 copies)
MALTLLVASGVALAVNKIGTNGPDTLRGTNGADNLGGLGSNDKLYALERVMNLSENRVEMRIQRSAWFPRDLRFPHS